MPRMMEIVTPLGGDVLLFHGMTGWEAMNRGFEWRVELLSEKNNIKPDDVLGTNVTIKLVLRHENIRFFNGFVSRFSHGGGLGRFHRYVAIVRPWAWFLTRTADCRIFQEMTVPDILKQVFNDHGMADYKFELTGAYRKWTYCVQYRETDFNFVNRLMEEEGIAYYYRHSEGHNTLVLTDSTSKHKAVKDCEKLSFIAPDEQVRPDLEHISRWDSTREVQPGVYVHDDYNFEVPSTELKTTKTTAPKQYKPSNYEVYDYPGHYGMKVDGDHYASVRIDELGTQFESAFGVTNARALTPGALLKLENHPREDQNAEYLITSANYELRFEDYETLPDRKGSSYSCSFSATPSGQQYRPARVTPKPFVQGPQTAVVTGPAGEEIFTDKYGRVKVQFHWDRMGKKDENSSCWVRVSSPWAGKNWGGISIPRIGQEVVVDFLEGDPDQPLITGRVYNAEQMPPYALPANKTQSGVKSRSSIGGTPDNFNEIRFEDLKGSEQLFIHAEKNQDIEVENDETHWVGHDRKKTIDHNELTHVKHDRTETVDNDETITVHHDRSETVDNNETINIGGNRAESVEKNETITIGLDRSETVSGKETITIGKDRSESVGGNEQVSVAGNRAVTVTKNESITVSGNRTSDIAKNENVSIGKKRATSVGEDDTLQIGKKLVIDAGDQITIQTGQASIVMKKDGTITIKGKDITLDGSGKINIKASSDVVIKGSKVTQN